MPKSKGCQWENATDRRTHIKGNKIISDRDSPKFKLPAKIIENK